MNLINFYRISNYLYLRKIPIIPKIIYYLQFVIFNSSVPPSTTIGKNTRFAYGGIGVVIHGKAKIGSNCIIGQGITIGGKSKIMDVPRIGDNVYIAAGVRIIGNVSIGDDVVIGANAVVVKDIPSNSVVAGIPAKVIKSGIFMKDFV